MATNKKFEDLIKNNPSSLVQQIVTEVVSKKAVEVHFEEDDNDEFAIVRVHNEDEDQELAIRCLAGEKWVLQFGFYDDEDEFVELLQTLAQPEIVLIPQGLQKIMRNVLSSEEGLRVPGNLLSR
jgi:hypothetical protein